MISMETMAIQATEIVSSQNLMLLSWAMIGTSNAGKGSQSQSFFRSIR